MDFGFDLIHGLAGVSTITDNIGIFFAQYLGYFVILFAIIGLFTMHSWSQRLYAVFFGLLSILMSWGVVKQVINFLLPIDRPYLARGFEPLIDPLGSPSMPSGHATIFFTLAMVIYLSMSARWGVIAFLAAALISVGRVFVGVHYPIDIIAGALIGILVPLIVRTILPRPRKHEPVSEAPLENEPAGV